MFVYLLESLILNSKQSLKWKYQPLGQASGLGISGWTFHHMLLQAYHVDSSILCLLSESEWLSFLSQGEYQKLESSICYGEDTGTLKKAEFNPNLGSIKLTISTEEFPQPKIALQVYLPLGYSKYITLIPRFILWSPDVNLCHSERQWNDFQGGVISLLKVNQKFM